MSSNELLIDCLKYLSPEFRFDSEILPPGPTLSLSMASADGRVMADLFSYVFEAFVLSYAFICLACNKTNKLWSTIAMNIYVENVPNKGLNGL